MENLAYGLRRALLIGKITGGLILKESIRLRSGATVPQVSYREAQAKNYLDRATLKLMHLTPDGAPAAYSEGKNGGVVFWFDPEKLTESDPELWYAPDARQETIKLESGTEIERMSLRRAASFGYYPKERLTAMHLEVIEEPVAFTRRRDKEIVYFYDKMTTLRMPLMCVKCGKDIRFKKKLCKSCYEDEMAIRRAEGDAHRNAYYGMDRSRVLFFDLELTGFYDHDEIISISIFNALGEKIMDTLVRPVHTKKWKRTEKIHGITPEMTENSPTLVELTPRIKEIFANADNIIAYGVSTDYSHIKHIYPESQWDALHDKVRCCANEFVRYAHEHRPDVEHASLIDAMACYAIEWEGVPHSSIADTIACMKVWEVIFPNYYKD